MTRKIAVVGVGKLGLCFALNLERSGFEVWGIESNHDYLEQLKTRTFSSSEPEVDSLLSTAKRIQFTSDISVIVDEDIRDVFIMVATPSLPDGGYDHTQVERVMSMLEPLGSAENVRYVYVGCTTMPGYCNQLDDRVKKLGYRVSYNPEFIAQGSIVRDQLYPDQVLIGEANEEAGKRLVSIYDAMVLNTPAYCRMDPLSAEITKLATNCFLTTKISFANSIGDLATKAGADPNKILAAVGSDSRIGGKYLGYGFGFGGPCFPRDNRALGKFADLQGYPLHLSKATDVVNEEHLAFQLDQQLQASNEDEEIVFEGVAYKKGTTQITESQQLKLALALVKEGRRVKVIDRQEVLDQLSELYPGKFELVALDTIQQVRD
ncbi:MAG: UDP-glucose/GDP-mannose dehydrogenase family protein [Flavobacteriales bacterium]|nr:UDP-glucose/GDP-mannose dehydrogenase family protein [Flavobacteriales bacterium]